MERKVRESEIKFHNVTQNASDGIEWNLAMERITDLEGSAVIGMPIWEIIFKILPPEKLTVDVRNTMIAQWQVEVANGYQGPIHLVEYEIETPKRRAADHSK